MAMRVLKGKAVRVLRGDLSYPWPWKCGWCEMGWCFTEEVDKKRGERFLTCRKCGVLMAVDYNPGKRRFVQLKKAWRMIEHDKR